MHAMLCVYASNTNAQDANIQVADSLISSYQQIPKDYYSKVNKKLEDVNDKLTKKSLKYLAKFQKQEEKMQKKLAKLSPDSAKALLSKADDTYKNLSKKIKSKTSKVTKVFNGVYNPNLDSLGTSLSFLKQFKGLEGKASGPLKSFNELQSKLQQTEKIKEFIAERKNQIKDILSKYTKLPAGLKNQYDELNKTAYYYSAQMKEYKEMLKDPEKVEKKALSVLSKLPAFQKFMKQNGQLASLFSLPGEGGSPQSLAGLQTRASVQSLIQQRIASGGANAQAQIQSNMAAAHAELDKLKDKLNGLSGGSGDLDLPASKINNQKTKTFLKRLEYSADVKFEKSNKLLPSAANIGLGIGYKLNDKSSAGIGLSYKVGMGTIQHISFTSQAIGFRSYMDWKIKKQIYVTGGYEMNYNTAFKNIDQLRNYDAWQKSALMGISKKYKISSKVKGEMKILYDFLANRHTPVTDPIQFRLGYKF